MATVKEVMAREQREATLERVAAFNNGRKAVLRELIERYGKVESTSYWMVGTFVKVLEEWLEEESDDGRCEVAESAETFEQRERAEKAESRLREAEEEAERVKAVCADYSTYITMPASL